MVAAKLAPFAIKATQEAINPLQADLFIVRGKTRGKRKTAPMDWEVHLNPLTLILAGTAAAGALWLSQLHLFPYHFDRHWGKWRWSNGESASEFVSWDSEPGNRFIVKDHRGRPPHREGYWVEAYTATHEVASGTGTVTGHGLGYSQGALTYVDEVIPRHWVAQPEDAWWDEHPSMQESNLKAFRIDERKGFGISGGLF